MGKGISRMNQKMAVAVGRTKETKDESFESTKTQFKAFEASVIKVHKAAKAYQAALGAFHKAQSAFAAEILSLYTEHGAPSPDEPDLANLVVRAKSVMDSLDSTKDRIYGPEYERRIVDPLTKYATDLKEVDRRINLRAQKVVDMDRYNRKLAGIDQAKHPEEFLREQSKARQTTDEYHQINNALIHDLPIVTVHRNLVLNSVFASSVNINNEYYTNCAQLTAAFAPEVSFVNVEGGISYSLKDYLTDISGPPLPSGGAS
ncbi:MAG: hypothetical protein Q8P67_23725, partial [archaeon]|nr:hypothetical protein [archaeon]